MMKNNKNIKFFSIIVIFIIMIWLVILYKFDINNKAYGVAYDIEGNKYDSVISDIEAGTEIGQTFVSKYNNLARIRINFYKSLDYDERFETGGTAIIGLRDEQNNIIKEEKISYNYIRTNNDYKFDFEKQKDSEGKKYYLYIKFLEKEDIYKNWFSINYSKEDVYKYGSLYFNNIKLNGDILFQEQYYDLSLVKIFMICSIVLTVFFVGLIYYIYKQDNINYKKLFLFLVPAIFILSIIITPTFKNHDEFAHWCRIYDISKGNLLTKIIADIPRAEVEKEVIDIKIYDNPLNLMYTDIVSQFEKKINNDSEHMYVSIYTTSIYSPIQYLPQVIGTFIASKFTDRPIIMAYSARIVNAIICAILLYLSIVFIPYGKKILLLLLCIPIAVEGFTSLSPDGLTISIAFLFIAYVLKLFSEKDKKINIKDKIILLCLSVILSLCKIVYLPIIGLLLILPKEKFKTKKEQIITITGILIIAIITNFIWLSISATYLATFRGGDSKFQLEILLQNPIRYLQMLIYTCNIEIRNYIFSMFGGEIGWNENIKLYSFVTIIFGGLFAFFGFTDEKIKDKFNIFQRVITFLIILAVFGLICTSLFIQWTPIGNTWILGIQGRYFIPILPLIGIGILSMLKVKNEYEEDKKIKILGISISLVYIYTFLSIIVQNI